MKREWGGPKVPLNARIPSDLRRAVKSSSGERGERMEDAVKTALGLWLDWVDSGGNAQLPVEDINDEEAEALRLVLRHYRELPEERRKMFVDWLKLWAGIG